KLGRQRPVGASRGVLGRGGGSGAKGQDKGERQSAHGHRPRLGLRHGRQVRRKWGGRPWPRGENRDTVSAKAGRCNASSAAASAPTVPTPGGLTMKGIAVLTLTLLLAPTALAQDPAKARLENSP